MYDEWVWTTPRAFMAFNTLSILEYDSIAGTSAQRFSHFKTIFRSNSALADNQSLPTTTTTTEHFLFVFVPNKSDISSNHWQNRNDREKNYIWKSREWIPFTKGVHCEFYAGYCVIDGILLVWEGNNKMIKIFLYFGSSFT